VDQLFVIAKNFLKEFSDFLEKTFDSYDIDYQEKILTINCPEERCFILHWHSPSQQLWLSSPLSGAWTFSYNSETEQWISSKHSKNLVELLKTELNSLVSS
jgi:iron donor protein CyaY